MNLFSWLSRHPLKGPSGIDRAQYTAEVMAKIKAQVQSAPAPAPVRIWLPWPRLAMTLATVAAGILIMLSVRHPAHQAQLTQEPKPVETAVLAESPATDDQWLEETMQLLDEFDDDVSDETVGVSDEEWLEELELLDEIDLAASS